MDQTIRTANIAVLLKPASCRGCACGSRSDVGRGPRRDGLDPVQQPVDKRGFERSDRFARRGRAADHRSGGHFQLQVAHQGCRGGRGVHPHREAAPSPDPAGVWHARSVHRRDRRGGRDRGHRHHGDAGQHLPFHQSGASGHGAADRRGHRRGELAGHRRIQRRARRHAGPELRNRARCDDQRLASRQLELRVDGRRAMPLPASPISRAPRSSSTRTGCCARSSTAAAFRRSTANRLGLATARSRSPASTPGR